MVNERSIQFTDEYMRHRHELLAAKSQSKISKEICESPGCIHTGLVNYFINISFNNAKKFPCK